MHNSMKQALLLEPDSNGIAEAASRLRSGRLVAFPTETVYGLGANALDEMAVLSIFEAKGRPLTDPLIVHIANPSDAHRLVDIDSVSRQVFDALAERFWPGPLTVIVKASSLIPLVVTAHTGFVGIRCPKHQLARTLIEQAGVPVAAPSANRFGHVSPTKASHVLDDLDEKDVKVINGESSNIEIDTSCEYGIESTVVKLDAEHKLLGLYRQGAVTQTMLRDLLAELQIDWSIQAIQRTVKMHTETNLEEKGEVAPGQAITHYAPDVPCYLVQSISTVQTTQTEASPLNSEDIQITDDILRISHTTLKNFVIIIDFTQQLHSYSTHCLAYRDLSPTGDSAEAAHHLFDTLRWAESVPNARLVLIAKIETDSIESRKEMDVTLGLADRIFRAASGVCASVELVQG